MQKEIIIAGFGGQGVLFGGQVLAYAAMDVFVFPSLTDTQGWVIHEAALAGLPLVLIDRDLSEVLEVGVNGAYANNNVEDLAKVLIDLLAHPKKRKEFGEASQKLARRFTEKRQVAKLVDMYETVVEQHPSK